MATPEFICANWEPGGGECDITGRFSCKNCLLVNYCGQACQKSHWPKHKTDCKNTLGKESWQPSWVTENRTPAFVGGEIGTAFGGQKYLWGNVPAIDVLQLGSNEGEAYGEDLRILFAASGDIRNVVKTVAQLPSSYNRSLGITINDRDPDIVARNLIMLLVALVVENTDQAIDCMIHIWYSVLIRKEDLDVLQKQVRPLIEMVCKKIKDKPPASVLAKTWKFGERSLRVVLEQASWLRLLSYLEVPAGLTAEQAHRVRAATTLAESRRDYRDRHFIIIPRRHRLAFDRFLADGLLLPFGSPRQDFQEPNPTFFQTADVWPMKDSANPLHGWSAKEVAQTSSGAATADTYGKLFYYLRGVLRNFLARLSDYKITFRLFHVDVADLEDQLTGEAFCRIETTNISDAGYLGIHKTLESLVPLLQTHLVNRHATLVTSSMNAVDEALSKGDKKMAATMTGEVTQRLLKYLPYKAPVTSPYDAQLIKATYARDSVATYDDIFDQYIAKNLRDAVLVDALGILRKRENTIVERWPYRLKLRPGQPGAQEEFDQLIEGGVSGKEFYIEWRWVV